MMCIDIQQRTRVVSDGASNGCRSLEVDVSDTIRATLQLLDPVEEAQLSGDCL